MTCFDRLLRIVGRKKPA